MPDPALSLTDHACMRATVQKFKNAPGSISPDDEDLVVEVSEAVPGD